MNEETGYPADMPEWARALYDEQRAITARLDAIYSVAENASAQIAPTLETLRKHPMAKMFGLGK